MSYVSQKVVLIFFSLIFWIVINLVVLSALGDQASLISVLVSILICTSITAIFLRQSWKRISHYQTHTFQWYVGSFPSFFRNQRVYCYACNAGKIHTRNLMNHTYTREHFCAQCGSTLYFSSENK